MLQLHKLLYLSCGITDLSCGSCIQESHNHSCTAYIALTWLNFCLGPAGCLMHFWTALNKVDFLRFKFHPSMDALKFKLNPNVDFLELRFTQIYRQRGSSQFKIYSQYGSSPFQIYSQQFQFQMSQELQRCRMRQELQRSWRLGTNHLKYHMRLVYRICNSFKEDMLLVY